MAQSRPRYDSYGSPIPPLSEARQERLYDRPFNATQRRNLALLLEEVHQELLKRGTYAEVSVRYAIKDGVIMEEIHVGVIRTIVCPRET